MLAGCDEVESNQDEEVETPTPIEEPAEPIDESLKPSFIDLVIDNMAVLSATKKYDNHFKSKSNRFLPNVDWRFLKSLCWVESNFRPNVESSVGAIGLCQLMPATFEQYRNAFNDSPDTDPTNPNYNVKYAAAHMQFLIRFWRSPRPEEDRLKLATASYNAGQGWLLRAQQLCSETNGQAILYNDIIICLPDITGKDNSTETINHVIRVWRSWYALVITGA